jgi:hypothetical protein
MSGKMKRVMMMGRATHQPERMSSHGGMTYDDNKFDEGGCEDDPERELDGHAAPCVITPGRIVKSPNSLSRSRLGASTGGALWWNEIGRVPLALWVAKNSSVFVPLNVEL